MINTILPNSVIPYFILFLNCILFKILRISISKLVSNKILISEFISTLELCSDCAELGVVWEKHGNLGYGLALFVLCLWWSYSFEEAEACPCGPIEDFIIIGSAYDSAQKLFGQLLGAYATAKYTNCIWCWHLMDEHTSLHTKHCDASLQVTMIYGATIEGIITFISRFISLESNYWNEKLALLVNSITTVLLVLSALNTTGGYFNPIMASALTFNCKGNTFYEHLIVYWIGSLTGGFVARLLHLLIRGKPKLKTN